MLFTWLLTAAASVAVVASSGRPWRWLGDARWPVAVIIGSAAGLLVTLLVMPRLSKSGARRIYDYSYPRSNPRYEILLRSNIYKINDQKELEYSRRFRVRARQDELREFTDRFFWTGPTAVLRLSPGDNVSRVEIRDDAQSGGHTFFTAVFEQTLNKGEEYEFEVRWPPLADWHQARPFVTSTTYEPTYRINFDLSIPESCRRDGRAWLEVLRAVGSLEPFDTEKRSFDDTGRLTWTIERPKLYHCYRVRWQWSDRD